MEADIELLTRLAPNVESGQCLYKPVRACLSHYPQNDRYFAGCISHKAGAGAYKPGASVARQDSDAALAAAETMSRMGFEDHNMRDTLGTGLSSVDGLSRGEQQTSASQYEAQERQTLGQMAEPGISPEPSLAASTSASAVLDAPAGLETRHEPLQSAHLPKLTTSLLFELD